MNIVPGQRWSNPAEPELGLGLILETGGRTVKVLFPAGDTLRQYARDGFPLRRVQFRIGDRILGKNIPSFIIEEVVEEEDLLLYCGDGYRLPEASLHDSIRFTTPPARLQSNELDDSVAFDVRYEALLAQQRILSSPAHGFLGGRMALLPHQLFIAADVTSRRQPRVLLADEVGLGKTIEAGLVLHRLLCTGRVQRALILVPDTLVHQWFVEMWRRFNLWFHIFDEARCAAIEAEDSGGNPFMDDQLVLCRIGFPAQHRERALQLVEVGWDIVVVDEAHHLTWSDKDPGPDYLLVDALARAVPSVLLLTATPEQLGEQSHFARLRLLDPNRFTTFEAFQREAAHYQEVARIVAGLESDGLIPPEDLEFLATRADEPGLVTPLYDEKKTGIRRGTREEIIEQLIDRHGPCRVMYRNHRLAMEGFPERRVHFIPLEPPAGELHGLQGDSRVDWLADFLRENPGRKVLFIAHGKSTILDLAKLLPHKVATTIGVFHEDLELVVRDRQAAWFAEPEGAQILLCSEIGGEGRNFQFAHHLVLFDLPLNPELLEQRIGRLDRIGQAETIHIHLPFLCGSPEEILVAWYRDGLSAFTSPLAGGRFFYQRFQGELRSLLDKLDMTGAIDPRELEALVVETQAMRDEVTRNLEAGRDRLLERGSNRPKVATEIVKAIRVEEKAASVEDFLFRMFDLYGVKAEPMSDGTLQIIPDELYVNTFPGIHSDGMIVTTYRDIALVREDLGFVSWDHPMVSGALELILGSEKGNAAFAVWESDEPQDVWLEALYVIEATSPPALHVHRFLPPTLVRVVVSLREGDCTETHPALMFSAALRDGQSTRILEDTPLVQQVLPSLQARSEEVALCQLPLIVGQSRKMAQKLLGDEVKRLVALQRVNPLVRAEEIEALQHEQAQIDQVLAEATIRLDALRLIWKGHIGDRAI